MPLIAVSLDPTATRDMRFVVPLLLGAVLLLLALTHLYWAIRGIGNGKGFLPEVDGAPLFVPSRLATVAVAAALFLAAYVAAARGALVPPVVPLAILTWLAVGAGALFLLRAIGDLRYVGFFKTHRATLFSSLDTWLFSPLCLAIAAAFFFVALLPRHP